MSDLSRELRGIGGSKDLKKADSIKSIQDIIPYFNDLIERLNDKFKRMSLTSNFDCDLINDITIAAGTNIQMNIASNDDGTAGDNTVNQASNGSLTLGRAFFYGSNYNPQTGNGGSRFDNRFDNLCLMSFFTY